MRYLKIYFSLVKFSIQRSLQFKFDFFLKIAMDCFFYASHFLFFGVIMTHTNTLSGWTSHQTQMFVASICLMDAIQMTFFASNLWQFPMLVNSGSFDSYLLRPVSARFFTTMRSFQLDSFVNLIIAFSLCVYVMFFASEPVNVFRFILFLVAIAAGTKIFCSIHLMALCSVFWLGRAKGFSTLSYTANKLSEYPDSIFPNYFRKFLIYVLPYSLICSFPTRILFGENPIKILAQVFVGLAVVFAISQFVWKKGLSAYSSASS